MSHFRTCLRKPTIFSAIDIAKRTTTSLQISADSVVFNSDDFIGENISRREQEFFDRLPTQQSDGGWCTYVEAQDSPSALIAPGFYELEKWGVWSRTNNPKLVLPFHVEGEVFVKIDTLGIGPNVGREIRMSIGGVDAKITLSQQLQTSTHIFNITTPSRTIEFSDLLPTNLEELDDHRTLALGVLKISIAAPSLGSATWDGTTTFFDLANSAQGQLDFVGFHSPEPLIIRSETDPCHIILPFSVHGDCKIQFTARGYGKTNGTTATVSMGDSSAQFVLRQKPQQFTFRFKTKQPTQRIQISGLNPGTSNTHANTQRMGIGIHRLKIAVPLFGVQADAKAKKRKTTMNTVAPRQLDAPSIEINGFTTVAIFNETSNSNLWKDVVLAFLRMLREQPDATLIIQTSNVSGASFFSELMTIFDRVGAIKCRVIAIHTHDTYRDVAQLLDVADVYVHVDSSIDLSNVIPQINMQAKQLIISSPDDLQLEATNVVHFTPHRQPVRTPGYVHRVERELEYVLDWVRLYEEMQRAYKRWQEHSND